MKVRLARSKILQIIALVVAAIALIVLTLPFLPRLMWYVHRPHIDATPYSNAARSPSKQAPANVKDGNRLIIPDIGIDAAIVEGAHVSVLETRDGVWHEPDTDTPTTPGNMVIAGHRFSYKPHISNYFYNLIELKNGEKLYVLWEHKVYEYEINSMRTVDPTQTDIRNDNPSVEHELTLYTCTPLGSTAKRFVVSARLTNQSN